MENFLFRGTLKEQNGGTMKQQRMVSRMVVVSMAWMMGTQVAVLSSAHAESPCKSKIEAKHTARKAVHECLMAWGRNVKPTDADPSDDCSSKVAAFVQASKEFKACRSEKQKEREEKKKKE